ncbi:MAG TPA: hypothetical protein VH081_07000 [Solirubrobacteraceae bacterium]|jgi:hypothetical protein|nr:hypothetical protein [Solirubrobacteraceae bacterium]
MSSSAHECPPEPIEVFRDGLTLFRRAGLFFTHAYSPALDAALLVAPNERERDEWLEAIQSTRTAWMRAYERRDTGVKLHA